MKRTLATIAAIVMAQGLVLGIWHTVERGRRSDVERASRSTVAPRQTTPMDQTSPDLELRRPDGSTLRLGETQGRPRILHFWATWCPPCREELPGLLAYAAEGEMSVLVVSVDQDWRDVRRFLGSDPPPSVLLAEADDVEASFNARSLPVTFVVDRDNRLRLRLDGPRDWTSVSTREAVRALVAQRSVGTPAEVVSDSLSCLFWFSVNMTRWVDQ